MIISLLIFLITIPPVILYLNFTSSLAVGSALSAILAHLVSVGCKIKEISYIKIFVVTSTICAYIIIHLLFVNKFVQINYERAMYSILLIIIFIYGSAAIASQFTKSQPNKIVTAINISVIYFLFIGIMSILKIGQPLPFQYEKSIFPFSEPSHFAVIFTPFYIYYCIQSRLLIRLVIIFVVLILAWYLENLTLFISCILVSTICLPVKYMTPFLAIIFYISLKVDTTYYWSRLEFSDNTSNLSSLVYIQGWQLIFESLERTHGFGIGFQQLGVFGTDVTAASQITALGVDDLNILDGGFTLSKLLSEFGYCGFFLAIFYLKLFVNSILTLRNAAVKNISSDSILLFAESAIATYSVEFIIRGFGYFTPTSLLFISSLWIKIIIKNRKEKSKLVNIEMLHVS